MAQRSRSTASELESFRRVTAAASAQKANLAFEAQGYAAELAKRLATAQKLNSDQERQKAELRKTGAALQAELGAARKLRTKIVKLAEVSFGTGAPELIAFRAEGEG